MAFELVTQCLTEQTLVRAAYRDILRLVANSPYDFNNKYTRCYYLLNN